MTREDTKQLIYKDEHHNLESKKTTGELMAIRFFMFLLIV